MSRRRSKPPPQDSSVPRSGDQVLGTVITSGMVTSLLSPFIHLFVSWLERMTGMTLGPTYETQVLALCVAGVVALAAFVRMRVIHNKTAQDVQEGHEVPGLVTVKEVVKETPFQKEPQP